MDRSARSQRVSCIQLEQLEGETSAARFDRVLGLLDEVGPESDLVVLPELWWTGYFSFDRYEEDARPLDDALFAELGQMSARHSLHLVAGTFIEKHAAGLANCAVIFGPDGTLRHSYRKMHLFGYESEEAQLLVPGEDASVAATELGGLAATTCYDLRFPELYRVLVEKGAEEIIIPAAWPMARREHWRLLLRARAVENQAFVIGCNGAGVQGGVELAGHSVVIDPWGTVLAEAGAEATVLQAEIDLDQLGQVRREFPVLEHRRISVGS